ncbi:aspartate/glutamate racemase family protein [Winogradskyella alexanderae]|uniref:Aspartate/glutamate racemase family protein n=1 Tax=Winogradskyella alexanderae TaxID=2877123 RepID=A0ABS7XNM3_9FLAO|nr:aspartate/glutamate racemase family protein [Winogradskyella alexanderae]MCA0131612.1 aspartate/glutamate racemase family protein [Winogradskyella alexanderae]
MKKIGLIGGMSWESTAIYYELLNKIIKTKRGGFHSAHCILESLDFAEIEYYQKHNDWEKLNTEMAVAAENLENAGAELIILCTNTMHLCADHIKNNITIPFLHIAEATGSAIKKQEIDKVLLLGTKFTMERDFYKHILKEQFNIEVLIPSASDRDIIHNIIYGELVHGIITEKSRAAYQNIIEKSITKGAKGVVLGCTEIPLLIKQNDCSIPIFDTTTIHAQEAVEFAML